MSLFDRGSYEAMISALSRTRAFAAVLLGEPGGGAANSCPRPPAIFDEE